jgi:hypothetical protein
MTTHEESHGIPTSGAAAKGLLGMVFDLSFKTFVTPRIVQVVFILQLIGVAIGVLAMVVGAFAGGTMSGLFALLLSPVPFVLGALMARIYMELIIVLFRIYETLRDQPV